MGIFTRMCDIVNSNISAMLDRAEDPEKLLNLMVQEMEDTLVEIKAQCAQAMAQGKVQRRQADEIGARAEQWGSKARMAMEKGREDLAREAVVERRAYAERAEALATQASEADALVAQYQNDIVALEAKLRQTRERKRNLVTRHEHASTKRRAQEQIRRFDTSDVSSRLASFEGRIDAMEAEADLVNYGRKASLDDEFAKLAGGEDVDKELEQLRSDVQARKTQ